MTDEEKLADQFLIAAKENVKGAIRTIDPSPRDPLTGSLLKILDKIDVARKKLKNRF